MSLCITASEKISISSLTPEKIAHCKVIRAQVLAETGNKVLAHKTYKRAWSKFYQSSPEFKEHKKIYYQLYKENKQLGNDIISKSVKKRKKNFDKLSKKKICLKSVPYKVLNQSPVLEIALDGKEPILELLPNSTVDQFEMKHANIPVDEDIQSNNLNNNYDSLDKLIAHYENNNTLKEPLYTYDFDMIFHPEIYNEELSVEIHEQENV